MDDPQPRGIAETLVDLNQFHGGNIAIAIYASTPIFPYLYVVSGPRKVADRSPRKFQSRPVSDCARIQVSGKTKGERGGALDRRRNLLMKRFFDRMLS